jgi:hypothetical protein
MRRPSEFLEKAKTCEVDALLEVREKGLTSYLQQHIITKAKVIKSKETAISS